VDLTSPLRSLAPTVDVDVLTVLAHTRTPLTGRAVARLAGRSVARVQAVLLRLTDEGLVDRQEAPPSHRFSLNRDHLLAQPVLLAVSAAARLKDLIRDDLATWEPPVVHASLFGSRAGRLMRAATSTW